MVVLQCVMLLGGWLGGLGGLVSGGGKGLSAGPCGQWVAVGVPVLWSAWALHPQRLGRGAREPLGTKEEGPWALRSGGRNNLQRGGCH